MTLSAQDRSVLKHLQSDLSQSRQSIAEVVGMSATTLWRRVNELESTGVIAKTVALVDAHKAGLDVCVLVSVSLKSHEPDTRARFEEAINQHANVMECFLVTGGSDYMLIVRTSTVAAFEMMLMEDILGHPAVATASSNIALRQSKYTTALPL